MSPRPDSRPTLLIVWHSQTGGTRQMVQALCDGVTREAAESVRARALPAAQAGPDDVLACDAVIFAGPENLAAISGCLKDFFDRSFYPLLDRVAGLPYAQMVCAGSDGHNALRQVERIATGLRLRKVAEPVLVCTNAQHAEAILARKQLEEAQLHQCRELGRTMGAALQMGLFG